MINKIILGNCYIECFKEVKKSRLLIIKDNQVLVANYGGCYLLPGGKLEPNENYDMALVREIKEEINDDFFSTYVFSDINSLVEVSYYQENFESRSGKIENRLVNTQYYYLYVDDNFEIKNNCLSESEKRDGFNLNFVNIDDIDNMINNNQSLNPRKFYFHKELSVVMNYFNNTILKNSKVYKKTL